jgi:hypothetical protein
VCWAQGDELGSWNILWGCAQFGWPEPRLGRPAGCGLADGGETLAVRETATVP